MNNQFKIILSISTFIFLSSSICASTLDKKIVHTNKISKQRVIKRDISQLMRFSVISERDLKIKKRKNLILYHRDSINAFKSVHR